MNRMFLLTSALALAIIVSSNVIGADDKDDKTPSIEKIMETAHGEDGKGGIKAKVMMAFKDKAWDDVQSGAKDWVKEAEALSKAKPTKGAAGSWKKLTAAYEKNVKAIAEGAGKKDEKTVKAALGKINISCGGCHSVHKPKK